MKTKFYYIKLICFAIVFTSCKLSAQVGSTPNNYTIIPLNQYITYQLDDNLNYPENPYFKDIDGDLDKYVETWIGTENNKTFELIISKTTDNVDNLVIDKLIMRYKVIGSVGEVIIDTNNYSISSGLIIWGNHLGNDKSYYTFDYNGKNSGCGSESGWLDIETYGISNNQMKLKYKPWGEIAFGCNEVSTIELFPLSMELTKQ